MEDRHSFTRVYPAGESKWPWPVYADGDGPPVVVIHELMGMTDEVLSFGGRLVDDGFRVYLPVLFGPTRARNGAQYLAMAQCCISRQINLFATGRTSRVVTPLRRLVADVAEKGTHRVGVVGMCLSGGFALALAASPEVPAAVVSQPSLPLITPLTPWCANSLGLDEQDEGDIRKRLESGDVEIYLTRFSEDSRSPAPRQVALTERLGDRGITYDVIDSTIDNPYGFKPDAHSVLSVAPTQYPTGPGQERLQQTARDVTAFLRTRLNR